MAAYYAPQGGFHLSGQFVKPPAALAVTANVLLILEDGGLRGRGGWAMLPEVEKRFSFDFALPESWQIVGVTGPDRQPLAFERYEAAGRAARVHVRLPRGIPPGEEYRAFFQAVRTPPAWSAAWKTQAVEFPAFSILDATREEGALAVVARDNMTVRPEKLDRLVALGENELGKYDLAGVAPCAGLSV